MSLYSALGECGCKLALKFTASNSGLKPSLCRKPLALRERIFACETVESENSFSQGLNCLTKRMTSW